MPLALSELICNPDGSIYHLNLHPEDIADTIITVGDPDRVGSVSHYFDTVSLKKGKREFVTHTGTLNGKRLSVISTGIGTDNIDIVLNELDALANIDLKTRQVRETKKHLSIIRIGTSGAVQPDIPMDAFLLSKAAIGLDGLLHFYEASSHMQDKTLQQALVTHFDWQDSTVPYVFSTSDQLAEQLEDSKLIYGMTVTNAGFYGPQGRQLRLKPLLCDFHEKLRSFSYQGTRITNLEMETAGIYGLASLLGHHAVSMNAILANRATGTFSKHPQKTVDALIRFCLKKLT